MDLSALDDFGLVVTHGGFGRASRASGRSKAILARRVAELEVRLGVRLFERGARALRLTEEGAALHARIDGPLGEILEATAAAASGSTAVRGRLRVSTPVLFGQAFMGRVASDFARRYPEVRLEVVTEGREVDLVEEGYDVAVRVNPRPDERLTGRAS